MGSSVMRQVAVYLVFIEEWAVAESALRFALGDEVAWWLQATTPPEWVPLERLVETDVRVDTVGRRQVVCVPGALGFLAERSPFRTRDRVFFYYDSYGGSPAGLPATRATVKRIEVVTATYAEQEERSYAPIAGSTRLRDVETCPQPLNWVPRHMEPVDNGYLVSIDTSAAGIDQSPTYGS